MEQLSFILDVVWKIMVSLHLFLTGKALTKRYVFVKQFCNKHIRKDCWLSSVMITTFGLEVGSPGFQRDIFGQLFSYMILDKFLDDPEFFVSHQGTPLFLLWGSFSEFNETYETCALKAVVGRWWLLNQLPSVNIGFWNVRRQIQDWRRGWPQRLGLGTRSEELMKKDKLQEQKGGRSDFLGSVFLLLAWAWGCGQRQQSPTNWHFHDEIWQEKKIRNWSKTQEAWRRKSWMRWRKGGTFSISLFIISRGVHSGGKRQKKEKKSLFWSCEGRQAKERPFKEGFKERIHFINNRSSSCSERMYVEEMLINDSVKMISRHILAVIRIQGGREPLDQQRSVWEICLGDPIRNKKTGLVGRPWWWWKAKAKTSDRLL